MADFRGKTYIYPTPNNGKQEVGVFAGAYMYGMYAVGWYKLTGARVRVMEGGLPVVSDADAVQQALDKFAQERGLSEVKL